jgi:hypothetical protein
MNTAACTAVAPKKTTNRGSELTTMNCVPMTPARKPPGQRRAAWLNQNWPPLALHPLRAFNPAASNARDAAAHGFDFGQLGHECSCEEDPTRGQKCTL